jgi:hypothetical protein
LGRTYALSSVVDRLHPLGEPHPAAMWNAARIHASIGAVDAEQSTLQLLIRVRDWNASAVISSRENTQISIGIECGAVRLQVLEVRGATEQCGEAVTLHQQALYVSVLR